MLPHSLRRVPNWKSSCHASAAKRHSKPAAAKVGAAAATPASACTDADAASSQGKSERTSPRTSSDKRPTAGRDRDQLNAGSGSTTRCLGAAILVITGVVVVATRSCSQLAQRTEVFDHRGGVRHPLRRRVLVINSHSNPLFPHSFQDRSRSRTNRSSCANLRQDVSVLVISREHDACDVGNDSQVVGPLQFATGDARDERRKAGEVATVAVCVEQR
jgi:hypothetical protein